MLLRVLLAAAAAALLISAPAGAAGVAYVDNYNVWLSSPDAAHKFQLTNGGSSEAGWNFPTQGPDGKTAVAHRDTFEDGSKRSVLYLYGADGKLIEANVMPVYAGATIPVYPIGMDMDWESKAVAYGYSYCTFACQSTVRGYWLTFSDDQGAYPFNPQGQTDAYFPTFYGKRIISSDSGGSIFIQPDVAEAPFTNSYQGWIRVQGYHFTRAEVSPHQNMVAVEWSQWDGQTKLGEGISIGRHQGAVPSDVSSMCDVPVAAEPGSLTFSPDGTQMAWSDAEGVKVAGVPNLDASSGPCTLTQPVKVISSTGRSPSFGGVDVAAILNPRKTDDRNAKPPVTSPTPQQPAIDDKPLGVAVSGKATAAGFAKGKLAVTVDARAAGKVQVTATVPPKVARKLRLPGASQARMASAAAATGIGTVVARGSAAASGAGKVTVRLKPTKAARRAAGKLRGATLTLNVAQGTAGGTAKVKLR